MERLPGARQPDAPLASSDRCAKARDVANSQTGLGSARLRHGYRNRFLEPFAVAKSARHQRHMRSQVRIGSRSQAGCSIPSRAVQAGYRERACPGVGRKHLKVGTYLSVDQASCALLEISEARLIRNAWHFDGDDRTTDAGSQKGLIACLSCGVADQLQTQWNGERDGHRGALGKR